MSRAPGAVRERLLDAAVELLREHGPRVLTQPRVAKAAGVSQSHLTYYFPKRSDLLVAVGRHSVEQAMREMHGLFAARAARGGGAGDGRERVLSLVSLVMKDRARTRMLLGLIAEAEDDPALKEVLVQNVGLVRSLVALGIGRTVDDPDVDIALATLWGLGLQHLVLSDARGDEYTDRLIARVMRWLDAPPPTDDATAAG